MQSHSLTVETDEGGHIVTSSSTMIKVVNIIIDSEIADSVCSDGSSTRMDLWMILIETFSFLSVSVKCKG